MNAAREPMQAVRNALTSQGLRFVDLDEFVMGLGVAIGFGDAGYVIASISHGAAGSLYLTSGIVRDVNRDPLPVLQACNRRTQGNPAFAVFLHDADAGWDVLLQQKHPVGLMTDIPELLAMNVRSFPQVAGEARTELAADPRIGGRPYVWSDIDLQQLLIRSLM